MNAGDNGYIPTMHTTDARPAALTLRCVAGSLSGETLTLDEDVSLGRGDSCAMQLGADDDLVSAEHARIWRGEASSWWLEDADSSNGSFINGVAVERAEPLHNGDRITLGAPDQDGSVCFVVDDGALDRDEEAPDDAIRVFDEPRGRPGDADDQEENLVGRIRGACRRFVERREVRRRLDVLEATLEGFRQTARRRCRNFGEAAWNADADLDDLRAAPALAESDDAVARVGQAKADAEERRAMARARYVLEIRRLDEEAAAAHASLESAGRELESATVKHHVARQVVRERFASSLAGVESLKKSLDDFARLQAADPTDDAEAGLAELAAQAADWSASCTDGVQGMAEAVEARGATGAALADCRAQFERAREGVTKTRSDRLESEDRQRIELAEIDSMLEELETELRALDNARNELLEALGRELIEVRRAIPNHDMAREHAWEAVEALLAREEEVDALQRRLEALKQ